MSSRVETLFPQNGTIGFVVFCDEVMHWDPPDERTALTAAELGSVLETIECDFARGGHRLEIA